MIESLNWKGNWLSVRRDGRNFTPFWFYFKSASLNIFKQPEENLASREFNFSKAVIFLLDLVLRVETELNGYEEALLRKAEVNHLGTKWWFELWRTFIQIKIAEDFKLRNETLKRFIFFFCYSGNIFHWNVFVIIFWIMLYLYILL